jgi:AhpD family alkylhydroperoxidase
MEEYIMTKNRIQYDKVATKGIANMYEMEKYINTEASLDKSLIELIKIRVSQINGCAFCLNMHTKHARSLGETEQRIYVLSAWRETDLFTAREKAALEFAEKLTLIAENTISSSLYEQTKLQFDDKEYTDLVILINQINAWNRISISMGNQI